MKRSIPFLAATACIGFTVAAALAHGGGTMPRPFLQRHAVMGSLAAHMKAAKAAIAANDMKAAARQAEAIHWLARMLPDIFPKGSGSEMGETRAAAKIWDDWTGFVAAADKLANTAMALKTAAGSGNTKAVEKAFKALSRDGCGDCHTAYRTPKRQP